MALRERVDEVLLATISVYRCGYRCTRNHPVPVDEEQPHYHIDTLASSGENSAEAFAHVDAARLQQLNAAPPLRRKR